MTPAVRRLVRELAAAVIGDREDARIVTPVLRTMLQTVLQDFGRYYDARHAAGRIADHDLLMARATAARTKVQKNLRKAV